MDWRRRMEMSMLDAHRHFAPATPRATAAGAPDRSTSIATPEHLAQVTGAVHDADRFNATADRS